MSGRVLKCLNAAADGGGGAGPWTTPLASMGVIVTGDPLLSNATIEASLRVNGEFPNPITLNVTDCVFIGANDGNPDAKEGGQIFAGGDPNSAYGLNGAKQDGTPARQTVRCQ